jgi:hypothetical protein
VRFGGIATATESKKAPEAWLDLRSQAPFGTPSAWVFLVRLHACRAGLRFPRRNDYRLCACLGITKNTIPVREGPDVHQGGKPCELSEARPARAVSVGAELRHQRDERSERAANHRDMWDLDPEMHAYAAGPDLDRLITRPHGDPAR